MIDLSEAFDGKNTSLFCDKMMQPDLPGQFIAHIDFMGKNTYVGTSYGVKLSEKWYVKNGVRQGGISSGILFNF